MVTYVILICKDKVKNESLVLGRAYCIPLGYKCISAAFSGCSYVNDRISKGWSLYTWHLFTQL